MRECGSCIMHDRVKLDGLVGKELACYSESCCTTTLETLAEGLNVPCHRVRSHENLILRVGVAAWSFNPCSRFSRRPYAVPPFTSHPIYTLTDARHYQLSPTPGMVRGGGGVDGEVEMKERYNGIQNRELVSQRAE